MIQSVSVDIDDISPELSALLETRDALAEALSELGGRIASLLGLRDVGPVPGATANVLLQYKLGSVLRLVQSIKWNVPLLRSHRRSSVLGDVDTVSALLLRRLRSSGTPNVACRSSRATPPDESPFAVDEEFETFEIRC